MKRLKVKGKAFERKDGLLVGWMDDDGNEGKKRK